jgi:hypothetical protein
VPRGRSSSLSQPNPRSLAGCPRELLPAAPSQLLSEFSGRPALGGRQLRPEPFTNTPENRRTPGLPCTAGARCRWRGLRTGPAVSGTHRSHHTMHGESGLEPYYTPPAGWSSPGSGAGRSADASGKAAASRLDVHGAPHQQRVGGQRKETRRSAAMARRPAGEQFRDVSGPRDHPAPR